MRIKYNSEEPNYSQAEAIKKEYNGNIIIDIKPATLGIPLESKIIKEMKSQNPVIRLTGDSKMRELLVFSKGGGGLTKAPVKRFEKTIL